MSTQASQTGGNAPRPNTNSGGGGTMAMPQQRPNDNAVAVGGGGPSGGMSQQNLNGIVSDSSFSDLQYILFTLVFACLCCIVLRSNPVHMF